MSRDGISPNREVALLGAPVDVGSDLRGCSMGPTALRIAGIPDRLRALGFRVHDRGSLPTPSDRPAPSELKEGRAVAAWTHSIDRAVGEVMEEGLLPIVLGGDHSLSMGSVNGVARTLGPAGKPVFVLWIDAHADYNTPSTSPSGNLHGMALSFLCNEPELKDFAQGLERTSIDPAKVCVFGARSIDRGERGLIEDRGIGVIDMRAIDERGVAGPLQAFLEQVAEAGGHLHVSLDVDSLDPDIAPGVGTTVPGGLSFREAHLMMEIVHESGLLGSMDVVELNPFLDDRGRSAVVLAELVASAFGQTVIQRRSRRPGFNDQA